MGREPRRANMTLRQIEVFVETARSGNLTRAAAQLHITPSAASTALKDFERAIGEHLFTRTARGLTLNDRGRSYLPRAETALEAVGDIADRRVDSGPLTGRIMLACSPTINDFMPERVKAFGDANPGVEVDIYECHTLEAVAAVVSGTAQIGLVGRSVPQGMVAAEPWLRGQQIVVAGADSAISSRGHLETTELSEQTWIVGPPNCSTLDEFAAQGLVPADVRQMGLPAAVKRAVAAGMGIACLPRVLVERELESGALVELDTDLHLSTRFALITDYRRNPTALVQYVIEWLRAMRH